MLKTSRRSRLAGLATAVSSALVFALVAAPTAHADLIKVANKDILATADKPQLKHAWVDYYYYYDPSTSSTRLAESAGVRSVTWDAYELLSHGDTKYNYYYIQAQLRSTLNTFTYPYRAVKAKLSITANGKGVKVVAQSGSKSTTFGGTCREIGNIQLGANLGSVFSAGVGSATYTWCQGGGATHASSSKITRRSTSASITWSISNYEDFRYGEFDYLVKVPAKYKPNFRVAVTTPYDYFNSYDALVETFKPMKLDTKTYCRIGAKHCPAV